VRPAEHRLPSMSLRQPRRPDDMPVANFAMSVPPMDELIHLDFDADEAEAR
jgi:hypothetical protein